MTDRLDVTLQEADLIRRLQQRDPKVVTDIGRAYASTLRAMLRGHLGSDDQAVETIVDDALFAVWNSYDPKKASIRTLLFDVARKRLIDELRRRSRARYAGDSHRRAPLIDEIRGYSTDHGEPLASLLDDELRHALDVAFEELTPRERTALERRFNSSRGQDWAVQLEQETGKPAKGWRKASDDAKGKVQASLERQRLLEDAGGRHEFAKAKTSA